MATDKECQDSRDELATPHQPSRRRFLQSAAAAAAVGAAPHLRAQTQTPAAPPAQINQAVPPRPVTLTVNGRAAIIARAGGKPIEATSTVKPGDEKQKYSFHSFGAVFVEVHVDAELGTIRVPRVVAVYDVGRVLNQKTAHSQMMGGIVWGVGAALQEETTLDTRYGRFTNANLAEYHVPVNADIGSLDITFLDRPDPYINSLGVRGIGEIGITGVPAALANAVYHATGVRVRDLPIPLDKVMGAMHV